MPGNPRTRPADQPRTASQPAPQDYRRSAPAFSIAARAAAALAASEHSQFPPNAVRLALTGNAVRSHSTPFTDRSPERVAAKAAAVGKRLACQGLTSRRT